MVLRGEIPVLEIARTTKLCVALLKIAESLGEQFDGDILVVGQKMSLCCCTRVVDEGVGVCCQACNTSDNIAVSRDG